jgi:hypothetical protein
MISISLSCRWYPEYLNEEKTEQASEEIKNYPAKNTGKGLPCNLSFWLTNSVGYIIYIKRVLISAKDIRYVIYSDQARFFLKKKS